MVIPLKVIWQTANVLGDCICSTLNYETTEKAPLLHEFNILAVNFKWYLNEA